MISAVITSIRKELKKHVDQEYRRGSLNFFKEPIKCWGVRSPIVRRISSQFYRQVKDRDKAEIFVLAEELLKSNYNEEGTIAFDWIYRRKNEFEPSDFIFFDKVAKRYLTNWALVDDFCTHSFGELVAKYPQLIPKVKAYHKSSSRWVRRACAVTMIGPMARHGKYLEHNFAIARSLLTDPDDLVQKGYGWMLKVAADRYQKKVFDFVMKHKAKMPRTALRYAIEKMPQNLKQRAMG
ncbi:DNA alkylation repair protein [Patescibacteria group bacterium]|nr:DNA alkylation repair protein [Patescibacteria group bacterium]MBU1907216.1 DNA alkylation repair protein [Patescibacteria group bacterium]